MQAIPIHDLVDGTVVASVVPLGPDGTLAADAALRDVIALVDEDDVFADPAAILQRVARVRERGSAVAVRVAESTSRATVVLALVEPEVVVVPAGTLVASDACAATTLLSLRAHCERTNSVVLAEGVDSDLHRRAALDHGIDFGFGAALHTAHATPGTSPQRSRLFREPTWCAAPDISTASPFRILSADRDRVRSGKRLLVSMSAELEAQAGQAGPDTIALGTFQHRDHFTGSARRRWLSMSGTLAHVAVFAAGFGASTSASNLVPIDPDDPLVNEWNVIVLGGSFACALSALDLHRRSGGGEREFEYVVSYNRDAVSRAARATLSRRRPAAAGAPSST